MTEEGKRKTPSPVRSRYCGQRGSKKERASDMGWLGGREAPVQVTDTLRVSVCHGRRDGHALR